MVISPTRCRDGTLTSRCTTPSTSGSATPYRVGRPVNSTSSRTPRGSRPAGRCADSASATRVLSTEWMWSNSVAARPALLVCRWPIKCQRAGLRTSRCLSAASWMRFSPMSSTPAAIASSTRAAGIPLLTAIRRTSSGSRLERTAAASIRARPASSRSATGESSSTTAISLAHVEGQLSTFGVAALALPARGIRARAWRMREHILDGCAHLLRVLEGSIHRGESNVCDLVDVAQSRHHHGADLTAGYLRQVLAAQCVLDLRHHQLEIRRSEPRLLRRHHEPRQKLRATELLTPAILLDDVQRRRLDALVG